MNIIFHLGKRPLIMGIVNTTPDSFSGDGTLVISAAVEHALALIAEGADILDIGGESTRPGAAPVAAEEEIRRTIPIIAEIRKRFPAMPISIDTMKAYVAAAALAAGADIINDVSMLGDPAMAALAAKTGAYLVLMHNRGDARAIAQDARIGGEYEAPAYGDIVEDVVRDLQKPLDAALYAGIAREKIIVDPGLGFGKTVAQNCALIGRLGELKRAMDCSIMIGPSRKSFIGRLLDAPVDDRLAGTAAAVAAGIAQGADIVRVHDVKFMVQIARTTAAIKAC
jgi:dihydropteroate synthase